MYVNFPPVEHSTSNVTSWCIAISSMTIGILTLTVLVTTIDNCTGDTFKPDIYSTVGGHEG